MISAIVLAAGQSIRMGGQKMLMPWGDSTVIEKVVKTVYDGGIADIVVVTGAWRAEIEKALQAYQVSIAFNPNFSNGDMLGSVQVGIKNLPEDTDAAMIVLGDQPQIEIHVVRAISDRYQSARQSIIVPSYKMRRGHPWLVDKKYWDEILDLKPPLTLREFLSQHNDVIDYLDVDTASVLQDLDTRDDYTMYKP